MYSEEAKYIFYTTLYNKYYEYVFSIVRKSIWNHNYHDIEELTQNVFVISLSKYHKLTNHNDLKLWFGTTARNLTKNYNRKYIRESKIMDSNFMQQIEDDNFVSSDDPILSKIILREQINYIENKMNKRERELFFLYFIKNMSIAEISCHYDVSNICINTRIWRLRKKIVNIIYNYGRS